MAELSIERMAQNASAAYRANDDRMGDYWSERVEAKNLQMERQQRHSEWSALADNRHG